MPFSLSSRIKSLLAPPPAPRVRVLMVCMGNICRSPTAEAVLRHKLAQAGLAQWVEVESAGTHAYHVGSPPDDRSQTHAQRRGYDLSRLRARKVQPADLETFDLILAMDWDNLAALTAQSESQPAARAQLRRLTEFVPSHGRHANAEVVPDPYYGGPAGFEFVLDLIEEACEGLVEHLRDRIAAMAPAG